MRETTEQTSLSALAGARESYAAVEFPDTARGLGEAGENLDRDGLGNRRAVRIMAGAGIGMFGGFAVLFPLSLGVFLRPIAAELGWSRTQASLLPTAAALGMTISVPFLAPILARVGPRTILIVSHVALALCLAVMAALANSPALFALICLCAGLATSITTPGGFLLIIARYFDRRLGLALGFTMTGLGLGAFAVPLIAGRLIAAFGWRGAFLGLAVLALVCGAVSATLVLGIVPARFAPSAVAKADAPSALPMRAILTSSRFWLIGLPLFATTMVATGTTSHVPAALMDRGVRPEDAAFAAALIGAGVFTGRLGAAILMDRLFAPLVVTGCFFTGALGIFLIMTAPAQARLTIRVGGFCIGLITGADGDLGPVLARRYFGKDGFDRLFGLIFALLGVGGIMGPLLAGRMHDTSGGYHGFFQLGTILCLVSGGAVLLLGRYAYPPEPKRRRV